MTRACLWYHYANYALLLTRCPSFYPNYCCWCCCYYYYYYYYYYYGVRPTTHFTSAYHYYDYYY